jgi:hypothetical protein
MSKLVSLIGMIVVLIALVMPPAGAQGRGHGGFHGGGFHRGFRGGLFFVPYFGGFPYPTGLAAFWYCQSSNAYYPYVISCAVPWALVPVQ